MASSGPTAGGTAASVVQGTGTQLAWSNPSNALVNDANAASVSGTMGSGGDTFQTLRLTNFGFAIPASATIVGVTARIIARRTNFMASAAQLSLAGVSSSNRNVTLGTSFPGSPQSVGGASDLWGASLSPAIVNGSSFGIQARVFASNEPAATGQPGGSDIRYMDLTIEYLLEGIALTVTSAAQLGSGLVPLDVTSAAFLEYEFQRTLTAGAMLGPYLYISSPGYGDLVDNANFTVEWEFGPGVQVDYRLRIYETNDGGTLSGLVYDSGVVPSSTPSHYVDQPIPNPADLWVIVDVNTVDSSGRSAPSLITTAFTTPNNVTGVRTQAIGDCTNGGNSEFPHVELRWSEIDAGANAFIAYDVRRREAGETNYATVATITTQTATIFRDYEVNSGTVYEYAVVYRALTGGGVTLVSENQAMPARGMVNFDGQWLHNVRDPRMVAHLDSFDVRTEWQQSQRLVLPWGRQAGTMFFGENLYRTGTMKPHAALLPGVAANVRVPNGDIWQDLERLLNAQQYDRAVLCLRLGRERELIYCQITRPRRTAGQKQYTAELQFVEVST